MSKFKNIVLLVISAFVLSSCGGGGGGSSAPEPVPTPEPPPEPEFAPPPQPVPTSTSTKKLTNIKLFFIMFLSFIYSLIIFRFHTHWRQKSPPLEKLALGRARPRINPTKIQKDHDNSPIGAGLMHRIKMSILSHPSTFRFRSSGSSIITGGC